MIIAIDGPAGTGKSTVAKGVAKKLGFTYFDTGAMYRAAGWWLNKQGINLDDAEAIAGEIPKFSYEVKTEPDGAKRYFVEGLDITEVIRTPEISTLASKIAIYPEVRKALVKIQRGFAHAVDAVCEGRDMGTVVFPQAELKIYLMASADTRAERRYRELLMKFPNASDTFSFEQVLNDVRERDHQDMTRAISPLKKAADAVLIDTSDLTAAQVIEKIASLAKSKKKRTPMRFTYGLVLALAKVYLKLFFRLKVYGEKHFHAGSAIIAANHASNLDPPVVSVACPEEVHFLAKDSLFKSPLFGRFIRHLNAHPVAREAADTATFKLIIGLLKSGHKVILFPEGSRTPDGELQPIERGLPFLMMKARCRIQPAYVQGTWDAWPVGRSLPKLFGKIVCVFGSPIEWEEFEYLGKREAEERIIERLNASLRSLKQWLENGAQGDPP
jgi:cytidylate kinase